MTNEAVWASSDNQDGPFVDEAYCVFIYFKKRITHSLVQNGGALGNATCLSRIFTEIGDISQYERIHFLR